MRDLYEYHQHLIVGKITNTLTDEEVIEVNNLLNNDPAFRQMYLDILNEFPAELSANNFELLDRPGFWKELPEESKKDVRKLNGSAVIKVVGMAAAVAGLVLGVYFWKAPKKTTDHLQVNTDKISGIQLKLANGRLINLSEQKGNINEGSATLINGSKSLSYTVTGNESAGMNSISVPVGMDYKIVLSDGSEVWMNSVSTLEFPFRFSGNTREVHVTGEAYLRIAKDPSKPFIVHLLNSSVTVLGTEFNVNSYDNGVIKVALVEGSVNMTAADNTIKLIPGKEGIYKVDEDKIITQSFSIKNAFSWRNGLYYFQEADIDEISGVLKRWFGVDIVIEDNSLRSRKFKGIVNKNESLKTFLTDFQAISKIDHYFDKEGVLHFK